jgi:hypothetical protein
VIALPALETANFMPAHWTFGIETRISVILSVSTLFEPFRL